MSQNNYSVINNSLKYYDTPVIKGESLLTKGCKINDSSLDKNRFTILNYLKSNNLQSKTQDTPEMKECETV
jgi:hypothetical protein